MTARKFPHACLARPQSGGARSHPAAEPLEARTLLALTALGPLADAYVRDGTYAATNFGTAAALDVRSSTVADTTRIHVSQVRPVRLHQSGER